MLDLQVHLYIKECKYTDKGLFLSLMNEIFTGIIQIIDHLTKNKLCDCNKDLKE